MKYGALLQMKRVNITGHQRAEDMGQTCTIIRKKKKDGKYLKTIENVVS